MIRRGCTTAIERLPRLSLMPVFLAKWATSPSRAAKSQRERLYGSTKLEPDFLVAPEIATVTLLRLSVFWVVELTVSRLFSPVGALTISAEAEPGMSAAATRATGSAARRRIGENLRAGDRGIAGQYFG